MNEKNLFKFFVSRGAIIYTALSTALIVTALFIAEDASMKILMPKRFLFLILFSFILALGSTFLRMESISSVWARVWHATCFIGGFLLFLILCEVKFAPTIISGLIFGVIYVIIAIISTKKISSSVKKNDSPDTKHEKKKSRKREVEYTPMFKHGDK